MSRQRRNTSQRDGRHNGGEHKERFITVACCALHNLSLDATSIFSLCWFLLQVWDEEEDSDSDYMPGRRRRKRTARRTTRRRG